MITGKELYLKFVSANIINAIMIDSWDELSNKEKDVWITFALMFDEMELK